MRCPKNDVASQSFTAFCILLLGCAQGLRLPIDQGQNQDVPKGIAVITWSNRTEQFMPIEKVNALYSGLFGYDRIVSQTRQHPSLHPAWEKIALLLDVLPKYEAVLLIDDDIVISKNISVESYMDQFPGKDIIWSKVDNPTLKHYMTPITGGFIVKNKLWTRNFFQQVMNGPICAPIRERQTCCWEQDCIWIMTESFNVMKGKIGTIPGSEFDCSTETTFHLVTNSTDSSSPCDPFLYHGLLSKESKLAAIRKADTLMKIWGSVWERKGEPAAP
jgi:hypothetical protein